ncbi:translation initiation factor IF-2-like [Coturnix japonica]|uniref:translation initiation factor IF-2-like n=1 Tax=Coturnix japonica TaxID=93934 RepID=UPI0007777E9D|nr:translation initiation factor IF-2-like [Coturnix japonica]
MATGGLAKAAGHPSQLDISLSNDGRGVLELASRAGWRAAGISSAPLWRNPARAQALTSPAALGRCFCHHPAAWDRRDTGRPVGAESGRSGGRAGAGIAHKAPGAEPAAPRRPRPPAVRPNPAPAGPPRPRLPEPATSPSPRRARSPSSSDGRRRRRPWGCGGSSRREAQRRVERERAAASAGRPQPAGSPRASGARPRPNPGGGAAEHKCRRGPRAASLRSPRAAAPGRRRHSSLLPSRPSEPGGSGRRAG